MRTLYSISVKLAIGTSFWNTMSISIIKTRKHYGCTTLFIQTFLQMVPMCLCNEKKWAKRRLLAIMQCSRTGIWKWSSTYVYMCFCRDVSSEVFSSVRQPGLWWLGAISRMYVSFFWTGALVRVWTCTHQKPHRNTGSGFCPQLKHLERRSSLGSSKSWETLKIVQTEERTVMKLDTTRSNKTKEQKRHQPWQDRPLERKITKREFNP